MSEGANPTASGNPAGGIPSVAPAALETSAKTDFDHEYETNNSTYVPSLEMDFYSAAEKEDANYNTPAPSLDMEPNGMPSREVKPATSRAEKVDRGAVKAAVGAPRSKEGMSTADNFNMSADDHLYHQHPANQGNSMNSNHINKDSEYGRIAEMDRYESPLQRLESHETDLSECEATGDENKILKHMAKSRAGRAKSVEQDNDVSR